jgi:hypothetical protein
LHQQVRQQKQVQRQQQQMCGFSNTQTRPDPCGLLEFSSTLLDGSSTSCDIGHILTEIDPGAHHDESAGHNDFLGIFGRFTFDTATTNDESAPELVSDTVASPTPSFCECARDVFETLRSLKSVPPSHIMLYRLRVGIDLFERLVTCPVCYDLAKPPRITIQNVLLIGRLMFEITSGYLRYLRWIRESCARFNDDAKTVYLAPGQEVSSLLSLKVSGLQFQDLIIHGLRTDAERLSAIGKQFARRQHDRHSIGHEACPNAEGRCWKEEYDVDLDPLDICPRNPAAKTLTPCFRIVEEVQRMIKKVQDDIG